MKHLNFLVLIIFLVFFSCKKNDVATGEDFGIPDTSNEVKFWAVVVENKTSGKLELKKYLLDEEFLFITPFNNNNGYADFYGNEILLSSLLESHVYFRPYNWRNTPILTYRITAYNLVIIPDDYQTGDELRTIRGEKITSEFLTDIEVPLVYVGISNNFFIPEKYKNDLLVQAKKDDPKIQIYLSRKLIDDFKAFDDLYFMILDGWYYVNYFISSNKYFPIDFWYRRRNPVFTFPTDPEKTESSKNVNIYSLKYLNPYYVKKQN